MVEEVLLNLLSNMFDAFYGPKEIWCDGHEPKLVAPDDATTNLIALIAEARQTRIKNQNLPTSCCSLTFRSGCG